MVPIDSISKSFMFTWNLNFKGISSFPAENRNESWLFKVKNAKVTEQIENKIKFKKPTF